MTFDKFTIKAQEAIQSALDTAKRNGQQTIEPVHILAGVMDKGKDVTDYVLQKLGVNAQTVELSLQNEIKHLPQGLGRRTLFLSRQQQGAGEDPRYFPETRRRLREHRTAAAGPATSGQHCLTYPEGCWLHGEGNAPGHPVAAPRTEGGEPKRRRELPGPLQVCHQPRGAGAGRKTRPGDRP